MKHEILLLFSKDLNFKGLNVLFEMVGLIKFMFCIRWNEKVNEEKTSFNWISYSIFSRLVNQK